MFLDKTFAEEAKRLLLSNSILKGRRFVSPDGKHYPHQWLWDSCFHAIVLAFLGLPETTEIAKNEIRTLLRKQRKDGLVPHMIYRDGVRLRDIERWTFGFRHAASAYSQPPVFAEALKWINDKEFTQEVFGSVLRAFLYFVEKQDPDRDGLISNFHPAEVRDAAPEFDRFALRIPGKHRVANTGLHHTSMFFRNVWYSILGWDVQKIWKWGGIDVEDLMFNCIWVDGMYTLAEFAQGEQRKEILLLARRTENAILSLCWDEKDQVFYSLAKRNVPIRMLTISNLFPLLLPNLPRQKAEVLVGHLTDPEKFWTPYPIPSVAQSERTFDGDRQEKLLWRGPTWVNTNWYIIQGLLRHGYDEIARELTRRTLEMVAREGFWEFYNPFTGRGMRIPNFGWSTLAITLPSLIESEASQQKDGGGIDNPFWFR